MDTEIYTVDCCKQITSLEKPTGARIHTVSLKIKQKRFPITLPYNINTVHTSIFTVVYVYKRQRLFGSSVLKKKKTALKKQD